MSLHVSETHDSWRCKDCHVATGLRKGTRLEERKLPFDTIIFFTYSWSNEYTTTKICAENCLTAAAISNWRNFLKEVCADSLS